MANVAQKLIRVVHFNVTGPTTFKVIEVELIRCGKLFSFTQEGL